MARKNKSGQINFFKAMGVLGLIVIGAIAYGFLGSAPNLSKSDYHDKSIPKDRCLSCHMKEAARNPIMPHRPMENCLFCHRPAGE